MKYKINKNLERGTADYGWLKTQYSFSFASYYNPEKMGFESLRVINEDIIAPNSGFPTHAHKYMEILTWVLSGTLTHRDNLGNEATLIPGRIQRMYAGDEVRHSELNASKIEDLHLLQIWIQPKVKQKKSEYEEREIVIKKNQENILASGKKSEGVKVYQDLEVVLLDLDVEMKIEIEKSAYLQVISGEVVFNEENLAYGDSLELTGRGLINLRPKNSAQILLFKLY